jgi:hypothetical protein
MKDVDIRGIVLKKYYEHRRNGFIGLGPSDFDGRLNESDIFHIASQLGEHGLIHWRQIDGIGGAQAGSGKISAAGIDVIEGTAISSIAIHVDKSINVSNSTDVQIGNQNKQTLHLEIERLIAAINGSRASGAEKEEAKSLLRKFLENPIVSALVSGINVNGTEISHRDI